MPSRPQSAHSVPYSRSVTKKYFAKQKIENRINLLPEMSEGPAPAPSPKPLTELRLGLSPSYILVGVYRLSSDPSLRVPVWKKCKHGFIRGIAVGLLWVSVQTTAIDPISRPTHFSRRSSRLEFKRASSDTSCQSASGPRAHDPRYT